MSEVFSKTSATRDPTVEFEKAISQITFTFVDFLESVSYVGLDVNRLYDVIKGKFKSDSEMVNTIMKVLIFVDDRGTRFNRAKVQNRMSQVGKVAILAAIQAMDIKDKSPDSPDEVTFGRIVAVFPHLMLRVRHKRSEMKKLRTVGKSYGNVFDILCFPGGAALIPAASEGTTFQKIFDQYVEWAISFDKLIKESSNPDARASAQGGKLHDPSIVRKYAGIAQDQSKLSTTQRITFLYNVGIITKDGAALF
jgi:hypothetical protein